MKRESLDRKMTNYGLGLLITVSLLLGLYFYTLYKNNTTWYDEILNFKVHSSNNEIEKYILSFLGEQGYIEYNAFQEATTNPEILLYHGFINQNDEQIVEAFSKIKNLQRLLDFTLLFMSQSVLLDSKFLKLPQNYENQIFYRVLPFVRGVYNTQIARLTCHKQSGYRMGDLRKNAVNGYIDDVAALVTHFRNGGCYETGLPQKGEREKNSCILKHYMGDNAFLNDIYQKYAVKILCKDEAKTWVQSQLEKENSFFSQMKAEQLYNPSKFWDPLFFQIERKCFSIPFAQKSKDLRATKYFQKCIIKKSE